MNKIDQLFAKIPYNSYFGKYLKIWYQWFQGRQLSWGCNSANYDVGSQRLCHENSPLLFFFEFFENRLKSNSWWIAQNRFSKKVKQVLQRRRGEGRSCNRTAKENKMNYYENSYCRHFHDILSEFCLNGVFMNGFQLLWLLRSGKVVRYKIDIPIPDPWI